MYVALLRWEGIGPIGHFDLIYCLLGVTTYRLLISMM